MLCWVLKYVIVIYKIMGEFVLMDFIVLFVNVASYNAVVFSLM